MRWTGLTRGVAGGLAALALVACDMPGGAPDQRPAERPPGLAPPKAAPAPGPSDASRALQRYYAAVQADLLSQGLLRTDGGGPDTPYTDNTLMRNFERIAFYDEYERDAGLQRSSGEAVGLRKWTRPVRMSVEFGDSVPEDQRAVDEDMVRDYATRLGRITGHPVSVVRGNPNFHVLYMGEDDRDQAVARIKEVVPNVSPSTLRLFQTLPRTIHCLVIAFSESQNENSYGRAIAFIRAEHPELMRRSCVHEELAQGLGLANDSPYARPSIFNDDDEFALLTTHDEILLRLLYHPDLTPGMTPDQARPIVARILARRDGPV